MGTDDIFNKQRKSNAEKFRKVQEERKQTWLIVCEGEKTEPLYFKALYSHLQTSLDRKFNLEFEVHGCGDNTKSLVKRVDNLIACTSCLVRENQIDYEKKFVVFDKDDFPSEHFNTAIQRCHIKGYIPIWSNPCFELWYILHDKYQPSATGRKQYFKTLGKKFGYDYEKVGKTDPEIFTKIKDNTRTAICNSNKLRQKLCCGEKYADYDPCTMMPLFFEILEEEIEIRTGVKNFFAK